MSETISTKIDLSVLLELRKLDSLEIDSHKDILRILKICHQFRGLFLTSIDLGDLSFLKNMLQLERLDLSKCRCMNHDLIANCSRLKYLCLERISLNNISFVNLLINLEDLRLDFLKIEYLSSFENCKKLKKISLRGLTKMKNYEILSTAENLEELWISGVEVLDIDQFSFLKTSKTIKKVSIDLKNKRVYNIFYEFLEGLGIS